MKWEIETDFMDDGYWVARDGKRVSGPHESMKDALRAMRDMRTTDDPTKEPG